MIFETKFDIGQEVYFMYDNVIAKGVILHISVELFSDKVNPKNENYTIEFIEERGGSGRAVLNGTELFTDPEDLMMKLLDDCNNRNKK